MKTKQLVWTIGAILTLAIILSISLIDKKQETIIVHNPTYKGISSKALNLLRVECNDSSTVLDMEVTGPPKNWVRLKSSIKLVTENNQEFKTLGVKGLELDKECYLPESGKIRFSLIFEPLPSNTKSFHFLEGNKKGDWKIIGIRLTDELPKGYFRYTLKGEIPTSAFDGKQFRIHRYSNGYTLGRITVEGNQFEYHGIADSAMFCRIDIGQHFGNFIIEEGTVNIDMTTWMYPSGTPLNEDLSELSRLRDKVGTMIDSIRQSIIQGKMDRETRIKKLEEIEFNRDVQRKIKKELIKPFILKHSNDEAGAVAVQTYLVSATPEILDDIYPHLGPWILSREIIQDQIATINQSRKMAPGQPFIDFEGEDINGNKVKLSDYVGKGKYVIVDFSASWCGPCKEEMPNLSNVYNTFKGEKFDMITVMVWDKLEASKKMLQEFNVNWKTILNAGMKPMELYGFSGIPRIMLFAPDGTIVHNELRGNLIKEKVKEVLE